MSGETREYGEPDLYEITWMTGHMETIPAHQVSWPHNGSFLTGGGFGQLGTGTAAKARVQFHAEINGRWLLILSALEEDIRCIRRITAGERIPGEVADA